MQSDINHAKSRTFNVLLRFFQLGLCLCATFLVGVFFGMQCIQQSFKIIRIMGITMTVFSLAGMLFTALRPRYNRNGFLFFYVVNLLQCVIIIIYSASNYHQSEKCPTKTMFYVYYITNVPLYMILSVMILFLPFYWVQRVTNSPGSAVWPYLFFIYCHHTKYRALLEVIGLISLITNILTWSSNGLALLNGVTTAMKKIIIIAFFIGLAFTGINEILAIVAAFGVHPGKNYDRIFVKSMLQTYTFINGIDLVFWILGMMSLNHENGDVIRDQLLNLEEKQSQKNPQLVEEEGEFQVNYGLE